MENEHTHTHTHVSNNLVKQEEKKIGLSQFSMTNVAHVCFPDLLKIERLADKVTSGAPSTNYLYRDINGRGFPNLSHANINYIVKV